MKLPPELDNFDQIQKFANCHKEIPSKLKIKRTGTLRSNKGADDWLSEKLTAIHDRSDKPVTRKELISIVKWKSPGRWPPKRIKKHNQPTDVEIVTRAAFAVKSEKKRIHLLMGLYGVSWPTASAILHFVNNPFSTEAEAIDKGFPILDVRVMRTVKVIAHDENNPPYSDKLWKEYIRLCRDKAKEFGVSLRDLDRALWTWDKCGCNSRNTTSPKS